MADLPVEVRNEMANDKAKLRQLAFSKNAAFFAKFLVLEPFMLDCEEDSAL